MNFDVLRQTVSYAKEQARKAGKIFKFTCTTNGLLLDREKSDYLNEEMDNVVLSLDGRREVNDFARPCPNGRGSFDLIVDYFRYFRSIRGSKSYFLRGTFTHFNTDFAKDVLFMRELGFEQLSVEPAVLPRGSEMEIKDSDLPEIFGQYEELAKQYVKLRKNPETWFSFFHFNIDLENGPCLKKRLKGCGAGCEYLAVVPDGGVYPCHQFAGEKEYLLGNVFDMSLDESQEKNFCFKQSFFQRGLQGLLGKISLQRRVLGKCGALQRRHKQAIFSGVRADEKEDGMRALRICERAANLNFIFKI